MFRAQTHQGQTWSLATDENAWHSSPTDAWTRSMASPQQMGPGRGMPAAQQHYYTSASIPMSQYGLGLPSGHLAMSPGMNPAIGMGMNGSLMRPTAFYNPVEAVAFQPQPPSMYISEELLDDRTPKIDPEDFVSVSSANWSSAITQAHGRQQEMAMVNKKKSPAQVAIEDQLNSQSLYKTELCRSFEETGVCRYGNKCQFAHGKDELRPVLRHPKYKTEICRTFQNTGTCPYGKRCRFIHLTADEGNVNSINIIPWSKNENQESSDSSSPESSFDSSDEDLVAEEATEAVVQKVVEKVDALAIHDKPASQANKNRNTNKVANSNKGNIKDNKGGKGARGRADKSKPVKNNHGAPHKWRAEDKASAKEKKSHKRRLAFFARLSGDTNSAANAVNPNAPVGAPGAASAPMAAPAPAAQAAPAIAPAPVPAPAPSQQQ